MKHLCQGLVAEVEQLEEANFKRIYLNNKKNNINLIALEEVAAQEILVQ